MAKKWSTGLVNFVAGNGSLRQAASGARTLIFEGSQVGSADLAAVGTLLATLTKGGGSFTGETLAEWQSTLSGSSGSLSALILGALVRSGTAQAGAAGTITLDAGGSATDDEYNGMFVLITGGTGANQYRRISDYVGSTKVATVASNWATTPDATSTFQVVSGIDLMSAAESFATDLTTTAANVAANINAFASIPDLTAYSNGAVVNIVAPKATGSLLNGFRLFSVGNGVTATVENGGLPEVWGVDCVNGVTWQTPAVDGVIAKEPTVMQGNGVANGTAGWFRMCFDAGDDGLSASTVYKRLDGNCGTSDTDDLKLSALQVQTAVPVVINTFPLSVLKTLTS